MSTKNQVTSDNGVREKGKGQFKTIMGRLSHNPTAMFGLVAIISLIILAILAPYISPYDYAYMDTLAAKQGPSKAHLFGTDDLGRDILSRLLYGGRYSLTLGFASVALSTAIAAVLGATAGFFGGWVDNLVMRILDGISAIPGLLLAILVSAALGTGFANTVIALAVGGIGGSTRLLRAQVMSIRDKEFVEAAKETNCSYIRIRYISI